MAGTAYQLELDEEAVDETFYGDIVLLEVEESEATASTAHVRLHLNLDEDGEWTYVEDDRLELFTKMTVMFGFTGSTLERVFDGYITAVELELGELPGEAHLAVRAVDTSVLMSMEEKVSIFANLSDSDIVQQIMTAYGVRVDADSTATVHAENDTTIVQRGSDIHFVRELARRNGYDFYFASDNVTGEVVAHFKEPKLDGTPQADLAVQFGDESNLRSFNVSLSGRRPLNVNVRQLDIKTASTNSADAAGVSLDLLGSSDDASVIDGNLSSAISPKDRAAQMLLLGPPASDTGELQALAQGVRNQAGWLIGARGEINSIAYQNVLRAHKLVLVKGAGGPYSGKYYVTRVRHEIDAQGEYAQHFEARRNARDLDGSEQFGAASGGLF
ncbi:MAG TPA: contractile injection system protein, VgrG/Pvc8 family [Thermoanaerobaculia bacterium]|nr:contractile injection system protein, VgrG/Pvc8 family [Thermoanaerobaculia bacterium]